MFTPDYIPEGFNKVEAAQAAQILSKSGSRQGVYFFKGDRIVLGDQIYSKTRQVKTADGKTEDRNIPYIAAEINGKNTLIPMSAFRNFPVVDTEKFFEAYPQMKPLYNGSDYERYELLKGKTLTVVELVDGKSFDFAKSDFTNRNYVYKNSKFAVFNF